MSSSSSRRVLITGAAKRLGRALALHFAGKGYAVIAHYHSSASAARDLAREIRQQGSTCDVIACDLGSLAKTRKMLSRIKERFGPVDILINNASVFIPDSITQTDQEIWLTQFQVNLFAPYLLSSQFAQHYGKGQIINILDSQISGCETDHFSYLLTKKALAELTRMAAVALAPRIRVNAVAPGAILAPEGQSQAYLQDRVSRTLLRRPGSCADVAAAVQYVVDNPLVTGEILYVDGGSHLKPSL